eukprot:2878443-Rhodomonas_salina.1
MFHGGPDMFAPWRLTVCVLFSDGVFFQRSTQVREAETDVECMPDLELVVRLSRSWMLGV